MKRLLALIIFMFIGRFINCPHFLGIIISFTESYSSPDRQGNAGNDKGRTFVFLDNDVMLFVVGFFLCE